MTGPAGGTAGTARAPAGSTTPRPARTPGPARSRNGDGTAAGRRLPAAVPSGRRGQPVKAQDVPLRVKPAGADRTPL
ncbi:hypothetical protein GCM10017559_00530 [Streptosporangium longisporum]|uniref:Uncharacterized protein n=1 Tax=Streptosporangium longisporum TaxID=46187 RepID=A0ABN3XPD4_9ACTN